MPDSDNKDPAPSTFRGPGAAYMNQKPPPPPDSDAAKFEDSTAYADWRAAEDKRLDEQRAKDEKAEREKQARADADRAFSDAKAKEGLGKTVDEKAAAEEDERTRLGWIGQNPPAINPGVQVVNTTPYPLAPSPLMSNQPANLEQDPADLAAVLSSIDGVRVGGYLHTKLLSTVAFADKHGWVARRMQALPVPPVEIETLEITDAGLEKLRAIRGDAYATEARAQRDWYRKQPGAALSPAPKPAA
jgi:hypothetical protein